jgi:hypothetical protein
MVVTDSSKNINSVVYSVTILVVLNIQILYDINFADMTEILSFVLEK